jgi:hypothetical protein
MRRLVALCLAGWGCGEDVGEFQRHFDLGICGAVDILDDEGANHVPQGTEVPYGTNPPASGDHFMVWAGYDRTYASLERGFWLHNVEHGAIALLHRCDPTTCPATVAGLEDAVRAFPDDPTCVAPVRQRALVVFDPLLPEGVEVAAIAWTRSYTATCVDGDAIAQFHSDFYNRGLEDFCADGASLGGILIE